MLNSGEINLNEIHLKRTEQFLYTCKSNFEKNTALYLRMHFLQFIILQCHHEDANSGLYTKQDIFVVNKIIHCSSFS